MFTVFVLKKDKNGVECCVRQGRAIQSRDKAEALLERIKKGVLLDIGGFDPKGLSNIDTFLRYGCMPVKSKGLPAIECAMLFRGSA